VSVLPGEVVAKEHLQVSDRAKEEGVHRVLGNTPVAELCTIELALHLGMDTLDAWTSDPVACSDLLVGKVWPSPLQVDTCYRRKG